MFVRVRTIAFAGLLGALLTPLPVAQASEEPLPRFEGLLCPGVAGITGEGAAAMVGRMRHNAEALGLRMAEDGNCEANLIVAFVDDGSAVLTGMEKDANYLFQEMHPDVRNALLNAPGPAHVLLHVVPRARDGRPIPRRLNAVDVPQTTMWMAHSKIYAAIRNDIVYALVLFDRDEISGIGLGQLADYATFRGLTQALPATDDASILALFEGEAARPAGLTEFDRTYLATLYEGIPNMPGSSQVAEIARATGVKVEE